MAAITLACGVSAREELVGRYEARLDGRRELWALHDDGTCQIARHAAQGPPSTASCEWQLTQRDGRRVLVVSVRGAGGGVDPSPHRTVYVLTPSRFPGGRVSIPIGPGEGRTLRKVD